MSTSIIGYFIEVAFLRTVGNRLGFIKHASVTYKCYSVLTAVANEGRSMESHWLWLHAASCDTFRFLSSSFLGAFGTQLDFTIQQRGSGSASLVVSCKIASKVGNSKWSEKCEGVFHLQTVALRSRTLAIIKAKMTEDAKLVFLYYTS